MEAGKLSKIIQIFVIVAVVGVASYFALENFDDAKGRINISKTINLNNIRIPVNTDSLVMAIKARMGFVAELVLGDDKQALDDVKKLVAERQKGLSKEKREATDKYILALDLVYKSEDTDVVKSALEILEATAGKTVDPIFSYTMLGWAQVRQLDHEGTVRSFRKAHELDPKNLDFMINLVRSLLNVRKLEEASKLTDDILKIDPENKMAQTIKTQLARVKQ